jgi:hypothetical protein
MLPEEEPPEELPLDEPELMTNLPNEGYSRGLRDGFGRNRRADEPPPIFFLRGTNAYFDFTAISPVSSSDLRLERMSGQPPETA